MSRSNKIYLVILIVLSLCLAGLEFTKPDEATAQSTTPLLMDWSDEAIAEIVLSWSDQEVRLKNLSGHWVLTEQEDYPANQLYVSMLLSTLSETGRGDVITRKPEDYPRYHLDENAMRVRLFDKDQTLRHDLYVGKPGEGYRSAYVRLAEEQEVRFVASPLIPMLFRNTWADKTVWRMSPSLIEEIKLEGFPVDFHAVKQADGTWRLAEKDLALTTDFYERLLPMLADLKASNVRQFTDEVARESWRPNKSLKIAANRVPLILNISDEKNGIILGKRPDGLVLFVLPADTLEVAAASVRGITE